MNPPSPAPVATAQNLGVATLLTFERLAFAAALVLFAVVLVYFLRRDADGERSG